MDRYLYLPIEVGSRELASKSLIALAAAEQGYSVVLGFQHTLIRSAPQLPNGLFLSKSSNNVFLASVKELGQAGHLVVASEEENFGYRLHDSPITYNSKFLGGRCDLYLCIGDDEAAYIERRYGPQFPKVVTGNARADYLRPQLRAIYKREADDVRKQHGKFILFNSNFGFTSPISGGDLNYFFDLWTQVGCFDDDNPTKNKEIFNSFVDYEQRNMRLMRDLLGLMSKHPEYTVVVRPHPVESLEIWIQFLQDLDAPNIRFAPNTNHIPYMLASDLLVHPGCTTGVEALALGVPALSLMGSESSSVNNTSTSNAVNVTASTAAGAFAIIEDHWQGGDRVRAQQPRLRKELGRYLADISEDVLSADKIVDAMTDLFDTYKHNLPSNARALSSAQWNVSPGAQHPFFMSKYGVTDQALEEMLSSLRTTLNRFQNVQAKKIHDHAYLINAPARKKFWRLW